MRLVRRFCVSNSGTSAVEFAFVGPLLLIVAFGIVTYASVLSTYNGIQQLAAESARASVAGLTDTERDSIARNYVASTVSSYPFIDATKLVVTTASTTTPVPSFKVSLNYDMSQSFFYKLGRLVPLPNSQVSRSAVVQRGNF